MRALLRNPKVAVSVVFVAAMFMSIMDITIVNVALPTIGHHFAVQPSSLSAVAIGYLVSLAVVIPASGWLGDRFGGKNVLLFAVALFTAASALCGLATSFGELVGFRVLQGVGGGMLAPVGMAMLFRTFPPAERVRASSILVVPTALAPALGPVLGGLLTTDLSWRWVFYVNVPIGVATIAFGLVFLADQKLESAGRFDLVGFLLSGVGFALLMYGVSEGPEKGWHTPLILGSIALGLVGIAVLIWQQLRVAAPLLELRLFRDRLFRSTNATMFAATAGFLGALYIASLFFQDGLGLSPLASGLSTFPEALGVMGGAQLASRFLYPAVGPRRVMTGGLLGVAASLGLMALVDTRGELWWMRVLMFTLGFSMAHVFVPTQAAAFARISAESTARGSTIFNAQRQLGGAVGVAVLSTVLAAVGVTQVGAGGRVLPHLAAYHVAFLAAAGLALLAAVAALTVRDADAESTRVRRPQRPSSARAEPTPTPAPAAH